MVYKNFRLQVIVRVLLLVVSIVLIWITYQRGMYIIPVLLGLILIIQVYSLIQYIDKSNRDIANFLESIRFSEFTRSFEETGKGKSFKALYEAFANVMADFQKVRSEREESLHYLQSVVQNLDVCIIAFLGDGTVELFNNAAKKLFQINAISNVNELKKLSTELVVTLLSINPGEYKLVKVFDKDDILHLSIHATEIKIKNKRIKLTSITNIQNVLEENETEAWQKLIRVLTHEIMNSITPIASLSTTLEQMLTETAKETYSKEFDYSTINEISQGIKTINKRSTGLMEFVDSYRGLTRIPQPDFKIVRVCEIFANVCKLFEDEFKRKKISIEVLTDPLNIEIFADERQIEQVIINLIQNSIQGLEGRDNKVIKMNAFYNRRGKVLMQIIDNGQGILPDVLDKIFVPFFTTKQQGSGIGLSLSRQILRLHNGTISAQSEPEKETIFTLTF
ncbi:MAG: hypothetical protein JXB49_34370 [Bacteroidales bacterium]|nr:hypothetical protein [Bacteroidales bacterium]